MAPESSKERLFCLKIMQFPSISIDFDRILMVFLEDQAHLEANSSSQRVCGQVTSRADARLDGKSGLDQFVPFFRAAKLSLWWCLVPTR